MWGDGGSGAVLYGSDGDCFIPVGPTIGSDVILTQ